MISALFASIAVAAMQQNAWKTPISIGDIQLSPTAKYAALYDLKGNDACIFNVRTHTCIKCSGHRIRFSADEQYAIYGEFTRQEPCRIVNLASARESALPFQASMACFGPKGHILAIQPQDDPSSIGIYDLQHPTLKRLSKFVHSIESSTNHGKQPLIHLNSWGADGIEIGVNLNPLNASDTLYVVDPVTDSAKRDIVASYVSGFKLADGSVAASAATNDPLSEGVGVFWNNNLQRMLFTRKEAGPEYASVGMLAAAQNANVLLAYGRNLEFTKGAVWAINVVSGKRALLVKEKWIGRDKRYVIPAAAISPDGKWVLYSHPSNDHTLSIVKVPKRVVVVNLSQSQKSG